MGHEEPRSAVGLVQNTLVKLKLGTSVSLRLVATEGKFDILARRERKREREREREKEREREREREIKGERKKYVHPCNLTAYSHFTPSSKKLYENRSPVLSNIARDPRIDTP